MTPPSKEQSSLENTVHKTTLSWFFERVDGAKESFSEYVTKASVSPLSWMTEEDLHNLHMTREKNGTNGYINPQQVIDKLTDNARHTGEEKLGTAGRIIFGGLTKAAVATGTFFISSIAAVGMTLTKGSRRVTGSVALLGNMLREEYHTLEDALETKAPSLSQEESDSLKDSIKQAQKEFNESFSQLSEESKSALKEASFTPNTSYVDIVEKADIFRKKIKELSDPDKEKLTAFEHATEKLIELLTTKDKYLIKNRQYMDHRTENIDLRNQHDEQLSAVPGVKEVRENVQQAKSFVARLFGRQPDSKGPNIRY